LDAYRYRENQKESKMLVLSRKNKETIHIGDAKITITHIGPSRVKIGIEAPPSVRILRGELEDELRSKESSLSSDVPMAVDAVREGSCCGNYGCKR
jgi:carbon storage regulator